MKIRSAMRVYPDTKLTVRVAADEAGDRGGCFHLEQPDRLSPYLRWVPKPEGASVEPISIVAFAQWLLRGGLGDNAPDIVEEVTDD